MELLHDVRGTAESISLLIYSELLSLIDVSLGPPGLLLPDIIDLDRKCTFEQVTIPRLRERLLDGSVTSLTALHEWLSEEASGLVPGADPLPALRAPLSYVCNDWAGELEALPLFKALRVWARQ